MSAVICGSLAFDTIMTFQGRFAEQILPDQLHILNVSFLVPALRRDFGGCAGNIAYSLKLLGGEPLPMATVGSDGARLYRAAAGAGHQHAIRAPGGGHVHGAGDDHDGPRQQPDHGLPSWRDDAGARSPRSQARPDIKLGIISPDGRDAMLQHAQQFKAAGIPFVFDPGQGLPMFDGARAGWRSSTQSTWVTVNDYEGKMLSDRTGWSSAEISRRVQGAGRDAGRRGLRSLDRRREDVVPPVKAAGSGRSHRLRRCLARRAAVRPGAGLAAGALRGAGQPVGAIKIASRGPQNYTLEGF